MTIHTIVMLTGLLPAVPAADCLHLPAPAHSIAQVNDNRTPAGTWRDGALTMRLVAEPASWYPDGPKGCGLNVFSFAEEGGRASIPGPLIRVRAGTRVRITLRNALDHPILVRGLEDRPVEHLDSTMIPAGAVHVFEFVASTPGSYFYWARTKGSPPLGSGEDAQLAGALIIDEPDGAPSDRILVLTRWSPPGHLPLGHVPESDPAARRFELNVINGRSWPHTERLAYTTGDTVRMRVINAGETPT